MHPFEFYLKLGFEHISNLAGYDHILFLVALCAVYELKAWRKLLILVTAFTIGHSVTLALVALDVVSIPSKIIKVLIPATILITALHNVMAPAAETSSRKMAPKYAMALFFGFIHGMDFSNYFKALIMGTSDIIVPLLGFNLGIEIGQLLIVLGIIALSFVFLYALKVKLRVWTAIVSGIAAGISFVSILDNL